MASQTLPQLCSEQQDSLGFSSDLQQLYTSVVAHGNARKRKLSEVDEAKEEEEEEELDSDLTPSLGW